MLVIDASAAVVALVSDDEAGERARARLKADTLAAPELIDLEVLAVIRRLVARGVLAADRAGLAVDSLRALPVRRVPHRGLLARCWALRDNLTAYDASYVALAESLGSDLLTRDARLTRAPGVGCRIEVLR